MTLNNDVGLAADLGDGHGFVELVNGLNRAAGGSGDQDEGTTNMAGDYYAAWSMNETGLHPWKREFPLEHIVEIYHQTPETNGKGNFTNVTLSSVEGCELLFDLGLWALITFGAALEPFNNNQIKEVPVVAERLLDMPFSGIDVSTPVHVRSCFSFLSMSPSLILKRNRTMCSTSL